jgi:outer membrane protein OmpA-like peptidoglycan-associated protein
MEPATARPVGSAIALVGAAIALVGSAVVVILAVVLGAAPEAFPLSLERFIPAASPSGILDVDAVALAPWPRINMGLWLNYARDPLRIDAAVDGVPVEVGAIVHNRLSAAVVAQLSLPRVGQLALRLPAVVYQDQDLPADGVGAELPSVPRRAMGDIGLAYGLPAWQGDGWSLGLRAGATLPTGQARALTGGDTASGHVGLSLVAETPWGSRLASVLDYAYRPERTVTDLTTGPELRYGLGLEVPLRVLRGTAVHAFASVTGATAASTPFRALNQSPAEVLFGGGLPIGDAFRIVVASGVGLRPGVGTPDARLIIGFQVQQQYGVDSDGDGLSGSADACPALAEDPDGFADHDGCPEGDNDGDGVADVDDPCPRNAEDWDGFEDADGCPEPAGLPAPMVEVMLAPIPALPSLAPPPSPAATPPSPAATPPSPAATPPSPAATPTEPLSDARTATGPEDPEDPDSDGVVHLHDLCPHDAGPRSFDGCPQAPLVHKGTDRLVLKRRVRFARGSILHPASQGLVAQVARALLAHPEWGPVTIEGHTDSLGDAAQKQSLSLRRARAVRALLLAAGLAPHRLRALGYGGTKPVAAEYTASGRALNHRIEFRFRD